jgi:hypothetical protein
MQEKEHTKKSALNFSFLAAMSIECLHGTTTLLTTIPTNPMLGWRTILIGQYKNPTASTLPKRKK